MSSAPLLCVPGLFMVAKGALCAAPQAGDLVRVLPGDRVPVDGQVGWGWAEAGLGVVACSLEPSLAFFKCVDVALVLKRAGLSWVVGLLCGTVPVWRSS